MQEHHGIRDEWAQNFGSCKCVIDDLLRVERWSAEALEESVVLFDSLREFFFQDFRTQKVARAQACARGFVGIGRADASFGGADFLRALLRLAQTIEGLVIRKNEMGGITDE